ncbi:MAG: hypothetical protein J6Z79_06755 [Clostridia bacterium]|nr:hypothetical protein [Clostridia bacterium]
MKGTWRTEPEKSIGGTTFHYIRIEADGSMTVHYCFEDSTGYEPVDSVYNVSPVFCPEEGLIRDSKGSTVWYAQLEPRVALIQKTGKTVSEYYHIELE